MSYKIDVDSIKKHMMATPPVAAHEHGEIGKSLEVPLLNVDPVEKTANTHRLVIRRGGLLILAISLACVCSLGLAGICSAQYPVVISHALLAFTLGLRHAVDVDHLAAIDNVTRQLLNQGQWPVSLGFWFAIGHSTIVVVLTAVLAGGYSMAWHSFHGSALAVDISLVAGMLSVSLLAVIGLLNAGIAVKLFRRVIGFSKDFDHANDGFGAILTALPCLRRSFTRVDKPYKMYGIGFLFGLSFDTATQVALIGLATLTSTGQNIPPMTVMIFPLCFSCGMCLVDSANGILMVLTYGFAVVDPTEKIFYNFVVTALSAAVALAIGTLEFLQILQRQYDYEGPMWTAIKDVDMASLGYLVIGVFLSALLSATCARRCRRKTDSTLEERPDAEVACARKV